MHVSAAKNLINGTISCLIMPKKMFVTKCGKICYKVRQLLVVTKCCKKIVTKCGRSVCYKVRQSLLQSAAVVTKCGQNCYKVRQLLQSAAIVTKWSTTTCSEVKNTSLFNNYDFKLRVSYMI